MNITTITHDKGNYILLSIVDVNTGTEILTFANWFPNEQEIDKFKEGRLFKRIFNTIFKYHSLKTVK